MSPNVNVISRLEIEPANYGIIIQHLSHDDKETAPLQMNLYLLYLCTMNKIGPMGDF